MGTAGLNNTVRYVKPSMTDLPPELGRSIFNTILNSPAPDFSEADRRIAELEEVMRREREENARKGS